MPHELGCTESGQGCGAGSFPLTRSLPRKYRPSKLSTQEKSRRMGKEGYTLNTQQGGFWPRQGLRTAAGSVRKKMSRLQVSGSSHDALLRGLTWDASVSSPCDARLSLPFAKSCGTPE